MNQPKEKLLSTSLSVVLRKLWPALSPYRFKFALGVALILATTAIEIILPILVGKTVDTALGTAAERQKLIKYALLYLGMIFTKAGMDCWQAYVIQSTGQGIIHDLRHMLFSKLERLPVSYFDRQPSGRLVTRVVNDIKSLSELFTASISVLALDFLIISGTIIAMFWMHWKLALAILATFPIVVFSIHRFGVRLAFAYRRVRQKLSEINAFLGENIGAIATIQRLGAEKERFSRFEGIVMQHQDAQMETLQVFALVQPLANLVNGVAMATLVILGGYWVIQGSITAGVVVAFLGYQRNLFQPIRDLVEKYNTFLSAMVAAERVVGILDEKTENEVYPDLVSDKSHIFESGTRGPTVSFHDVSFQYSSRNKPALQNLNFNLPSGKSLAIVGATGSGKSTIIRLLLRYYQVTSGHIMLGGQQLERWSKETLRRSVGVVHQEIYLFQGTIRENLTLGRLNLPDEFLIEQCRRVQLWDFIEERGGLDLLIYEGGSNLSLGERQLLSFARILVLNTPLLVLDEATSSVDRITERKLMEAIHEVISGRTSIVIAHRLSTIRACDHILVLDKGHVAEEGDYEALLEKQGLFRKLHDIHSFVDA